MSQHDKHSDTHKYAVKAPRLGRLGVAVLTAVVVVLSTAPVGAQGWWPWSNNEPERPPIPDEPVYREEPGYRGEPGYRDERAAPPTAPPTADWSTRNPVCLQLEQRLVQDTQRSSQSQNMLPQLEDQIRELSRTIQGSEQELNRRDCYEQFLFSKTLRRTRVCVDLARQREQAERQLADVRAQRQQIVGSSERSYRNEIVRDLARNNCGENYVREARRQDRGGFSNFWQDSESSYSNGWTPNGGPQSYATYRTVCVRLCDGYYFPVSFSTLPSHFEQDAAQCQSKCAAPAALYYYQNPGATVDQSVAVGSNEPYTSLKTAFRYRKELVQGCSCKQTEYVPPAPEGGMQTGQQLEDGAAGWAARSEWEAQTR